MIGCLATGFFSSCGDKDDPDTPESKAARTVLIYMCAENNLNSTYYTNDSTEIVRGAANLPDNVNLIVYADRSSKTIKPFIAKVDKRGMHIVKSYKEDFYSTDKGKMSEIINWVFTKYPANSYAMSFWGHGNGWVTMPDQYTVKAKARRKAYGWDSGRDNTDGGDGYEKYINIPELAEVLSETPHLDYIFFDCCQMMCAELTYELRNVCDYIIGSPAEIPGDGAPYEHIVPNFFLAKENVGKAIVDDYISHSNFSLYDADGLPMSVVKTSNMENLLHATQSAIDTVMTHYQYPNNLPVYDVIYYGINELAAKRPIYYDLRHIMRKYLSDSDFTTWDNTFKQAVVYSVHPKDIKETGKCDWLSTQLYSSHFNKFLMNDDNYGGLSMFIPQTYYSNVDSKKFLNPNVSIKAFQWNKGIDWTKFGWE
ncbi:MAG: hypothetical protein J5735_01715 [Prevotella sp.]|nr:hypothetical protein [Prevotella sp.]